MNILNNFFSWPVLEGDWLAEVEGEEAEVEEEGEDVESWADGPAPAVMS